VPIYEANANPKERRMNSRVLKRKENEKGAERDEGLDIFVVWVALPRVPK
jgi:hypothetical protein